MNEIAKMISDETKLMVEGSGKEFIEPDFDEEQTASTPEEITEFTDNVVKLIDEGTQLKKQERKEYRKMFGEDPKGHPPFSITISN